MLYKKVYAAVSEEGEMKDTRVAIVILLVVSSFVSTIGWLRATSELTRANISIRENMQAAKHLIESDKELKESCSELQNANHELMETEKGLKEADNRLELSQNTLTKSAAELIALEVKLKAQNNELARENGRLAHENQKLNYWCIPKQSAAPCNMTEAGVACIYIFPSNAPIPTPK